VQDQFSGPGAHCGRRPRDGIVCGFWLKRRITSPRLIKTAFIPPNYVYQFKLTYPDELDDEVASRIAEAYRVGEQAE
jgi:hypothetical protein